MDRQNKTITELTPEQMDKVFGGGIPEIMGMHTDGSDDDSREKDEPWKQN